MQTKKKIEFIENIQKREQLECSRCRQPIKVGEEHIGVFVYKAKQEQPNLFIETNLIQAIRIYHFICVPEKINVFVKDVIKGWKDDKKL